MFIEPNVKNNTFKSMSTKPKPNLPNYRTKSGEPNLQYQICTRNKIYHNKSTETYISKQIYLTKSTKPGIPNKKLWTKSNKHKIYPIESTEKNQTMITEPNQQIKISQT